MLRTMQAEHHLTGLRRGPAPGYNPIVSRQTDAELGLDFGIHLLPAGEVLEIREGDCETALLVLRGAGTFELDGRELRFRRKDWISEGPAVAHASRGSALRVRAVERCELARVRAENTRPFAGRLLGPDEVPTEHRGRGMLSDTAYRLVRTAFDRQSAPPESVLVLGEVVNFPGRWSSYPPHHHPQPEIYYYRFAPEQGYGHGELGDEVFLLRQHDLLRITGGRDHAQAAAPGYHMYYLWAIRHLPGAPYTGFEYNPLHRWLVEER